ncbi:MAG: 16S rRNA (cytidine(1402)-2'-O)-methyltransferase [bacterium]
MGTLYIIATPIGNLEDISFRAVETLKKVSFVLCEDTRVTKRLLNRYQIVTPTISYHQHSKLEKTNIILDILKEGKDLALVSDAGTPGISDPGGKLIQAVINSFKNEVKIIAIPGPAAVAAAISIAGMPANKFFFAGFPPSKNKRKKFFEEILNYECTVVFYESSHRIIKTLQEIELLAKDREAVVCQEMTKMFETIYRGNISTIVSQFLASGDGGRAVKTKGEFVIILQGKKAQAK